MIRRRILSGIGANTAGQLVNIGIQLALVPILVSHWGLGRYGVWIMITTIPAYLLVSDLGFARASLADITARVVDGNIDGAQRVFHTTLAIVGIITTCLAVALATIILLLPDTVFADPAASLTGAEVRQAVLLMALYGLCVLGGSVVSCGFQSVGHYSREAWLASGLWLIEGAGCATIVFLGGTMVSAAISYLTCRIVGIAIMATIMRRGAHWATFSLRGANAGDARRLARPALANMAMPTANALMLQGTALAIGWGSSPALVPAFTVVRTLSRLSLQGNLVVARAITPEFAMATARRDVRVHDTLVTMVLGFALAVSLCFSIGLVTLGGTVVALWTSGKVQVPQAMFVLMALSILGSGIWTPITNLMVAINRQSVLTYALLTLSIAAIGTTYTLAPMLGSIAGACGMILVDLGMAALSIGFLLRNIASGRRIVRAGRELAGKTWHGLPRRR